MIKMKQVNYESLQILKIIIDTHINNNEPISIDMLELISESLSITLKTEKGA